MRTDYYNWLPLTVPDIFRIFSNISVKWCIAGGWALDLYLGRQSRVHEDIDVIIFREDQFTAFEYLSKDWLLYKAHKGNLSLWKEGERLTATKDIWVSKDATSPWAFQIMIVDTEEEAWVYGRETSIRRPVKDICSTTHEGVPYLKPEIQLLYKGSSSEIRTKDLNDLLLLLPSLSPQAIEWLRSSLNIQFPSGHEWIKHIDQLTS
ncbi:nucleotidyltransferase domain-containing protein [Paenibacillus eucommiae]|uniref:Aminoglycoside-2''-adenylyltransferase n=1 Tax=Paenibacillus eucommiae TaxID=1355755 RepID=A0ABS4J3V6_9BACL|nr:hypothetical protein [Paenibacillus eucommiae]MBP1994523.1 hypothetical protein [Paenibacillus eucommiae]